MSIVYGHQVIKNANELGKLNNDEIWNLLETLRTTNFLLNQQLMNKESEITALYGRMADIDKMKDEIVRISADNVRLSTDNLSLHVKLDDINNKFNALTNRLQARQVGMTVDNIIMEEIGGGLVRFRGKPYSIRSYKNLCVFLADPTWAKKIGICHDNAPGQWENESEETKTSIRERLQSFQQCNPDMKESIDVLKSTFECAHPLCEDYDSLREYYKSNEELYDALTICQPFYK